MTKEKKCEMGCDSCGCGYHGVGQYHWHTLVRWILGLVIIFLVFNLGIKIGELESAIGRGAYDDGDWSRGGRSMMSPWTGNYSYSPAQMMWSAEPPSTVKTSPAPVVPEVE